MVGLVQIYNTRPSVLMNIQDEYTAYCLDEAVAYITQKIKSGEEPQFEYKAKSFSEYYKHILGA